MKLNVYENYLTGNYCAGFLLVAARSIEEAHEVCWNSPKVQNTYWVYDNNLKKVTPDYWCYKKENFELIPNLFYEGEPCVIEEEHYIDAFH